MNTLLCVYGSTTLKKGDSCPFSLDAFTDKNTAQLDHFWTSEMDAFSQDWQGSILWVHPPYSMADLVLQKIKETPNFTGCVFLPEWFSEDWFLEYMDCCTTFRSFHSTDGMFTLHGKHPQTRPNWNCTAFYFIDYQPDQTKLDFVLEGQLESPIEDVAITTSLKVTPLFISTITVILGNGFLLYSNESSSASLHYDRTRDAGHNGEYVTVNPNPNSFLWFLWIFLFFSWFLSFCLWTHS